MSHEDQDGGPVDRRSPVLVSGACQWGDRTGVHHVLSRAEELAERHDVPDTMTPCVSLSPYGLTRTRASAATAHLALGDSSQALFRAGQFAEVPADPWSRALVSLDAATAYLAVRDVERAMELWAAAIRQPAGPPIPSVVTRAHELAARATARWAELPSVQDDTEILRAWSATPAVAGFATPATMIAKPVEGGTSARVDRPGQAAVSRRPADPPPDLDSTASVAAHDWAAFTDVEVMTNHWDGPGWTEATRAYYWLVHFTDAPDLGAVRPIIDGVRAAAAA
ncbi:hypothetical protein ACIOC1_25475 [Streptomyces sp. NPDC088197]|uniref:hypothetical protein n=1 Tax=Streptomyces sp. NPDC088197 TaxID=3365840 RepID=UPI0038082CFC